MLNSNLIPSLHRVGCYVPIGSYSLLLKDLLKVHDIHKNLLLVSKFVKDNKVFFQFYLDHCFMKDMETRWILLQSIKKYGLYQFSSYATPSFVLFASHIVVVQCVATNQSLPQPAMVSTFG